MRRTAIAALTGLAALTSGTIAARAFHPTSVGAPVVRHEIIAVYLGTIGTDSQSGMVAAVRDIKTALKKQAVASGRALVTRGVSLEPSVDDGLRHLTLLGGFDEVSLGGNWTNSAVVRYLGGSIDGARRDGIPQLILLERDVTVGSTRLRVGAERELGRYIGTEDIAQWAGRGAPLPR